VEVKNQKFYHIHRVDERCVAWQPGMLISVDKGRVNFYHDYYNHRAWKWFAPGDTRERHLVAALEYFLNLPKEQKRDSYEQCLQQAYEALKSKAGFVQNTIFEEVRREHFPHLPSRFSCIWLCRSTAVEFWSSKLDFPLKQIVEVSATGIMHTADEKYLCSDTISHNHLRQLAFMYWTGTDGESCNEEILFEGILQVNNVFADINAYKASKQ